MAISEEYLIKFKGDNSQLKKKLTETGKTADKLKAKISGAGKALGALAPLIAVAAIVAKFKSVANEMDNISKSARKLGIATEELSALNYAASLSDVSFSSLSGSIAKMQRATVEASEGMATYADAFARAGIDVKELEGLGVEDQFIRVSTAIAAIEDPAKRTATAMDIFGRSGAGVLIMAENGAKGLREMTDEARKMGVVFDAEAGAKAEKFNDELTRMGARLEGVFMTISSSGAFDILIAGLEGVGWAVDFLSEGLGVLKAEFQELFNLTNKEQFGDMIDDAADIREQISLIKQRGDLDISQKKELLELQDQLVRKQADIRAMGEKAFAVDAKVITNIKAGNLGGNSETPIADNVKPDLKKVSDAIDEAIKPDKLEDDLTGAFQNAFDEIGNMSGDFGQDIKSIFSRLGVDIAKAALSPLASQLGNGLGGLLSGSSGGGGLFDSIGSLFSFDGGGYTGSGTRSGGMDGKGGMLSLVHPDESIIDHTKGQGSSGGGGVNVNQYNSNTFTSDTDIDRRIKAHQPIQIEQTKRAVLQALQSGGEYSKVNGSRL